ncbi:MAG: hypothetical protein Q4C82_08575 [Eubacteriales bacterium]|nr:hypothetical protein [Eubacteriales bacterium]
MKEPVRRRLLALLAALCVCVGSSGLSARAAQTPDVQGTEQGTDAETDGEKAPEETGSLTEQGTGAQPKETDQSSGNDSDDTAGDTSAEKPNTDVKVTPSNANALLLMDAGAQSPRAVPGRTVEVVLTLAVNREWLPSEKYVLRNITITPDIPTDSTKDTWPFDVVGASYVRHLDDMTYNSTAEVWYEFSVSEFAKEGVYPVNFTVNATVWREDSVNGTDITEDVEFKLNVFMTVTDNGDMSGVTSGIGPLNVAGRENTAIASPTGSPGETVVMSMPIVNKGGTLENVTVSPVVTGDLETFPFVAQDINYGREMGRMEKGDRQQIDWIFTISPYATTGNKVVTFRATYEENGVYGECTFTGYIYVKNGYTANTAASLMVSGYGLYVNDVPVTTLEAGNDAVLKVTLKNNAEKNAVYKAVSTLKLSDANSLILTGGYSDAAYVQSISAGSTAEVEYHITARASAAVGPSAATIALTYETHENEGAVAGSASSSIQIPVKQPMNLQLDTPVVYGSAVQGEPVAVSLNMVNLGRSRAYNVSVVAMDGVSMQDAYFGGDILAAGTLNADFQVIPNKSGEFAGTLVVQYEDADGELYTQNVALSMTAAGADDGALAASGDSVQEQEETSSSWSLWLLLALAVLLLLATAWYFLRYRRGRTQAEKTQENAENDVEGESSEEETSEESGDADR